MKITRVNLSQLFSNDEENAVEVNVRNENVDKWEIPRDRLVTGQKIGEGQFGMVLEGTLMTGEYFHG